MSKDDILFERRGRLGHVRLNRPHALNALTLDMSRRLDRTLKDWALDPEIALVAIRGAGERAFCAGGDVRALYKEGPGSPFTEIFYREEYALNRNIFRFPKPYVALIDGIVMGGGVGVSAHGSHRVVTERTLFAMPETGIGLFPDVGATWLLSRCPGETGLYLGLTGARIRAADLIALGLAEVMVPGDRLDALEAELAQVRTRAEIDGVLGAHDADPGDPALGPHRATIDRCFSEPSVERILAALDAEGTGWARETAATLRTKSPTSLKVTLRQLRLGRTLPDFEAAMRLEFRLVQHFMAGKEFFEGVRAVVIDKDQRPRWSPARLEDVTDAQIESYFAPLRRELEFPD
ncbi:MAG TPA: enoyl-CoA hydratase/isomerase family protein [Methylomirabilota bacterium]|jgi:enoyl-CoA hydratase|nr:enoyl-CoA hydratase/isomerase family protein [Methylomirabilota bacterium]